MSAPLTYGIAANAPHADCAAFFLNWVATNPAARKINVACGGSNPGGPATPGDPDGEARVDDGPDPGGRQAIAAKDNGDMGFIANANGSIYAEAWTPEVQKLFAGRKRRRGAVYRSGILERRQLVTPADDVRRDLDVRSR